MNEEHPEEVEKEFLEKEEMNTLESSECIYLQKKIYLIKFKERFVIVKRVGKCEPEKCKSACCKFVDAYYLSNYSKGFFDEKDEFGKYYLNKDCNNLNECGKCKKWNKDLPGACKQFPHPSDKVYWHIMDKCSFKFEVVYIIDRISDRVREEMMLNFLEQLK